MDEYTTDIETQNFRPVENIYPRKFDIIINFNNFYTLNPYGVSMATFDELNEILIAADKGVEIYLEMKADGELTWSDLINEASNLITLTGLVKEAIVFEHPVVFADLTKAQLGDLITGLIGTVFKLANVTPSGDSTATFKELKEIADAIASGANLFAEGSKDGKITLTDILTNLGGIIDFTAVVQVAAKVDGTISIGNLSKTQIQTLVSSLFESISSIINSIKLLQSNA